MKLALGDARPFFGTMWEGIRASLSDGQGYYLVAMALFAISFSLLHRVLQPIRRSYDSLSELVQLPQEPYRGETRPTLAAGLNGTKVGMVDLCRSSLLPKMEQVLANLERQLATTPPDHGRDRAFRKCATEAECPHGANDTGYAWTDRERAKSVLIIPSAIANEMSDQSFAVLAASRLVFDSTDTQDVLDASDADAAIRNIYFIDRFGSMRLTPKLRPKEESSMYAFRTYGSASYVLDALGDDQQAKNRACPIRTPQGYATLRYLDLAGKGVVSTVCYRVMGNTSAESDPTPSLAGGMSLALAAVPATSAAPTEVALAPGGDEVKGVLCFDLAPSHKATIGILNSAKELFDLSVVRFTGMLPTEEPCAADSQALSCLFHDLAHDMLREQLIPQWLQPRGSDQPSALSAGESAVRDLGKGYFATVIASDRQHQQTEVVFGQIKQGHAAESGWLFGFVTSALLASALVARGALRRSQRAESTLIRGLPIGVIEMLGTTVVRGNDRAEELVHHPLPTFGASRSLPPVPIGELFDTEHLVMLTMTGELVHGYEPVSVSEVDRLREEGYSSRYYAFSLRNKRWMMILGSPIVTPPQKVQTYAMIQPCDNAEHLRYLLQLRR